MRVSELEQKVERALEQNRVSCTGGYGDPWEDEFGLTTAVGSIEYARGDWFLREFSGSQPVKLGRVEWHVAVKLFLKEFVE